jgi:hypothetical protein
LARGVLIGVTAAVLIPVAAVALAPYWRPAARSALKLGILALEKAREAGAELTELVEDVAAEVQDDLRNARGSAAEERAEPAGEASAGNSSPTSASHGR